MDGIQMEPIGKYKADRNGSAKAAAWRNMIDQDLDDVAFLADSEKARSGADSAVPVAVCGQRRALCITVLILSCVLTTALVAVYATPHPDCPCADEYSVIPKTPPPDSDLASDANKERISLSGAVFPWRGARLPTFVIPKHYSLWLHPNLTTGELRGEVSIDFRVDRDTTFVVLNVRDMNVTERALFKQTAIGPKILRALEYPPAEQTYIEFKDKLRRKYNYTLSLRFITKLERNDKLRGFFLAGSSKNRCAVSRFWLTHARSAFPCFDEPNFRATFKLTIVRDRFHVSLTNMPIVATEEAGFYLGHRLLQDEFATTPAMSTHMMSMAVCRLQRKAAPPLVIDASDPQSAQLFTNADSQTTLQAKTTPISPETSTPIDTEEEVEDLPPPEISLYSDHQVILDESGPILDWVQKTIQRFAFELNTSYPLPKLDLVVIEGGNPYSEGWGLITLTPATLSDRKTIARLLAQQWFGGLVSPRWWSSQWLMLALTSVLAERAPAIDPDARDSDDPQAEDSALLLDHVLPALRLDASSSVRAVSSPRLDRADIEATTDELSLHKGAAIVWMSIEAAGGHAGRKALARLLRAHRFASADVTDLWRALQQHTVNGSGNPPPMRAWDAWSDKPGYPLLVARRRAGDVLLAQERFLMTADPPSLDPPFLNDLLTVDLRTDLDELFYVPENITEPIEDENATTTTPPPTTTTRRPKTTKPPPMPKWVIPVTFVVGPVRDKYLNVSSQGNSTGGEGNETITAGSRWAQNVTHLVWMNDTELTIPDLGKHVWVRYNVGARGLYRVAPQEDLGEEGIQQTAQNTLEPAWARAGSAGERALRLDDAFVLARASRLSSATALQLAVSARNERARAVWRVLSAQLSLWRRALADAAIAPALNKLLAALAPPIAAAPLVHNSARDTRGQGGWSDGDLLATAVEWENPDAIKKALSLYEAWAQRNQSIPEHFQEAAFTAGVRHSGQSAWRRCWRALVASCGAARPLYSHRALLAALSASGDHWNANKFAWTVLSAEAQRGREWKLWVTELFAGACRWRGSAGVWRLLNSGIEVPSSALLAAAQCLRQPHHYYQFKELFGVTRHTQPALDVIALNVAWSRTAEPELLRYFENHKV